MKNDAFIRESLQQNLSGLHVSRQQQINMIDEIVGGRKMKRKIPLSFALAAVLLLVSVTALAVGTNLFAYFAERDARYGKLAEQAANVTAAPIEMESQELGAVNARIDSAYYDGETLSVGFIIENASRIEAYTPTAEELASAQLVIDPLPQPARDMEEARIMDEFRAAVESGTPYGYAMCSVYAGDHMYANEIDLPPYSSLEENSVDGAYRSIRNYAELPEELLGQDTLALRISLKESRSLHYFDGKDIYHYQLTARNAGEITATVPRSETQKGSYAGSAEIAGVPFSAEVTLSLMQGKLTLSAKPDTFQPIQYRINGFEWTDIPWQVRIFDENNIEYEAPEGCCLTEEGALEFTLVGSGELPAQLRIYLLRTPENSEYFEFWPSPELKLDNPCIVLTAK